MAESKIGLLASEPPPPVSHRNSLQKQIAALIPALREQKGTWFRIGDFPLDHTGTHYAVVMRKQHPEVEWRGAGNGKGKGSRLYARYMGRP